MAEVSNEPLGKAVDRACVEALYDKLLPPMVTVAVNSLLLGFALWPHVDHTLLISWVAVAWLVAAARLVLGRAYRASDAKSRDHARWGRLFAWGSGLNGVVWGAGAALLMPDQHALQVLIVFVVGGMVAGAAASTSTYMPAFVAFALPAVAGAVGRIVIEMHDRVHAVMAIMLVLFAAAMTAIARRGGKMLATSERLRLVNDALAGKLAEAHDEVVAANESLEERVRVRTREAEEALAHIAQTNLLASIGQLASGVAHEINNPLSVVISNVDQVADDLKPGAGSEISEMLEDARAGADRIKRIVADLRLLARARAAEPSAVAVEPLLRGCANLLMHEMRQHASVVWELDEDVPAVFTTEAAFAQIVLNLLIEATQAIPRGKPDKHTVTIAARLADDGDGADAERRVRVEVFYRGSNGAATADSVGLAVCRNVLAEQGGSLDYQRDDGGTRAVVTLPAAAASPA
ncbi:MAG: HAMP domain-containing histidine kinase [Myxococcales bacterium]|nr:HAMP domain-containing histidine kinase [Myxococcales bacterium]